MAKRQTGNQVLENMSGNSSKGVNFREDFVDLKVSPQVSKVTRNLRLIGVPIEYFEAQPRKRSTEDPSKSVKCDFPDANLNKSFTRICDDDPSKDIWTQMGYQKTKRYAINCICIEKVDGVETRTVKILARGKSIFGEFYKTEKNNVEENVDLVADGEAPLWTQVGGADAPNVKIIAEFNDKALGNVEYSVRFSGKTSSITDEDIAMLRAIGEPTPEQLAQIRKENPDLADYPDWSFYGYDLEKIFKPTPLKTGVEVAVEAPTAPEEMVINTSDDDDEEVEEPKAKPVKKAKAAKVEEPEEDAEVPVEDSEEDVETEIEEVEW